jgi:putative tryptophan/tyrosine transport system substrate-binding protein
MPIRPMKRRAFIAALGSAAAWPLAARAQQLSRKVRIGVLLPGTPPSYSRRTNALLEGLRDLGYEEGKTVTIEWKWGNDQIERLPELAAELVSLDVQAIITAGTPAAKALKNATRSIPIIMAIIGDPVATGLADSLAHPGGNATGFSLLASELSGKRLELLKEVIPRLSSAGVILNPANPQPKIELGELELAAHTLGVQIHPIQLSAESSLQNSFDTTLRDYSVQAVIVPTDAVLYNQRKQIVALAAANRLPAMYFFREFVAVGGLMSYAPNDTDLFRRAASYVDKVLRGAKPGDLPIEQPTKFELVINLKTAKALSLDIPPQLLARADEVIE